MQNGISYTLDLNSGLTQILSDGTSAYLYGLGRIAQAGAVTEYFLGDALGSVRQLVDEAGAITLAKFYAPYGEVMYSAGMGQADYGFTGETTDVNGLVYLRARYYSPFDGRFLTRDPSRKEANLFQYASSNPVNQIDPTGLLSESVIGPMSFMLCFDFHSLTHGASHNADVAFAIQVCRDAFSKDKWNPAWFDFTKPPETAHDLMGWYLFEQGDERMWFDGNAPLAKELSQSTLISDIRLMYYLQGDLTGQNLKEFGYAEFLRSMLKDGLGSLANGSLPITQFLGSFKYQVVTLPNGRIGFRIDNRTDLESGTHIAGRFQRGGYSGSVEELLARGQIRGSDLLADVINGTNVISILRAQSRQQTSNPLGGGNMEQVYTWTEERNDCWWWMEYLTHVPMGPLTFEMNRSIQSWPNYQQYTQEVTWP